MQPTGAEVAVGWELDPLLGAADDDRLPDLTEVSTDALELTRRQLDDATVVSLLQAYIDKLN